MNSRSKSKASKIRLDLTHAEAEELNYLAGDLYSDQDELKARIGARRFKVACSAMAKLHAAMYAPGKTS